MHNNYYFLRQLSAALEKILTRTVVSECFSQQKDELIIRFETNNGSFFTRASVLPSFGCLSFPEKFERARKNSVDLFGEIIGQRVVSIRQFKNERSFAIRFTNDFALLFKMHGNHSNVIVFKGGEFHEGFRKNIEADKKISLDTLDREIDWSIAAFESHLKNLPSLYFTFGKLVWRYLDSLQFSTKNKSQQWELLEQIKTQLNDPAFYLTEIDGKPTLSLLKFGNIKKTFTDALVASNEFYYEHIQSNALLRDKNALLSTLRSKLQSNKSYCSKNEARLNELKADNNYKVWADLIMANLHAIKPNTDHITVANFYNDNNPIDIKLRPLLSAQKNAEIYYRKSKNQQIEINRLEESVRNKYSEISALEEKIALIENTSDYTLIRKLRTEATKASAIANSSVPYHEFVVDGYRIWVGKDAGSNDELTLKLGYKEDLWLHAKDVAGSHVLIKHQAGKKIPKNVIERAAQLAAYNSKRKNETLCPVVVTPKKFVRKRKGDPPGQVVVEREEVIMVEPKL